MKIIKYKNKNKPIKVPGVVVKEWIFTKFSLKNKMLIKIKLCLPIWKMCNRKREIIFSKTNLEILMPVIPIENKIIIISKIITMIKDKFQNMFKVKLYLNLKILKFYYLQKKRILSNMFKIIKFRNWIHKDKKINFSVCKDKKRALDHTQQTK